MMIANRESSNGSNEMDTRVFVEFGRDVCSDLESAEKREWLVTNGIGGFACGTLAGLQTRRYHGLLVAALRPPLGRTLLVSRLDEILEYAGKTYPLATNRWHDGSVRPRGFEWIERFRLEGTIPVWTYACADALVEKRIWMEQGSNTTYVRYDVRRASSPIGFEAKVLVDQRDYHSSTRGGEWRMSVEPVSSGLRVVAFESATPFYLLSDVGAARAEHAWYRDYDLALERERGLDDREDHLHAGSFTSTLGAGDSWTLVFSTDPDPDLDGHAGEERRHRHEEDLLDRWATVERSPVSRAPSWIRQLVLAADQFVVARPLRDDSRAMTVIAGYPWFGDWGRDTMIALPGLALTTGRPEIARRILRTFARFVDQGMLPNVFADSNERPEYNTVDATLWYFEALRQYFDTTNDTDTVRELHPVLEDILAWHERGTRYGIGMDPADGLLRAGEPGVQLTWMDAKVGDWVVTPRIGKPVEVNVLWYNALMTMVRFARLLGKPTSKLECMATRAREGFQRFWNTETHACYDVLDGPDGHDASVRPNQIFTVSLAESPLTAGRQRDIVEVCSRLLLTSHGLRSLSPDHPAYRGRYAGGPRERDGVYHQGTVWGWLLGPFVLAHLRVYGDPVRAAEFLEPMASHLRMGGLGTASEIFDGDAPFAPRGCFAQAWTVAEILRAWTAIHLSARARRDRNNRNRVEGPALVSPGTTG